VSVSISSTGARSTSVWTYEADEKHWTTKHQGVDERGRETSSTLHQIHTDKDTFTWEVKDAKVDGEDSPNPPPRLIVRRVKPK